MLFLGFTSFMMKVIQVLEGVDVDFGNYCIDSSAVARSDPSFDREHCMKHVFLLNNKCETLLYRAH